jgi:hypothetical protein
LFIAIGQVDDEPTKPLAIASLGKRFRATLAAGNGQNRQTGGCLRHVTICFLAGRVPASGRSAPVSDQATRDQARRSQTGQEWPVAGGRPGILAQTPSGTGLQLSLSGILGVTVGRDEGLELNVLGLVTGFDLRHPAIKVPGIGRVPGDS